jgi:hypothetical protein
MIDADGAQRAREWLERQLAELGQLRNATRRDQTFKTWRQQTLTVIQRIWPGDTRRSERFRRIPFTPPSAHTNERQVREYYERGWGEAGILLRELLAEINLLGLPQVQPGGYTGPETDAGLEHAPMLDLPAVADAETAAPAPAAASPDADRDDIGRAMERLLGRAPLFRKPRKSAPADERFSEALPPEPSEPGLSGPSATVSEILQLADGLDGLDLPPQRATDVRLSLLALAQAAGEGPPPWELVSEALAQAGASPALARRVLPLLLELVARAA